MAVMIPWGRGGGALVAIREADAFFMASGAGKFESALSSLFGSDMG